MSDLSISKQNYTIQQQETIGATGEVLDKEDVAQLTDEQLQAIKGVVIKESTLPFPGKDIDMSGFLALPSPGAIMMQTIVDTTSESKKINRMLAYEQGMITVDAMKAEAQEIRENAALQLALGIISGVVSIASGIAGGLVATNKVPYMGNITKNLDSSQLGALSQSVQSAFSGAGKMIDSGATYANSMSQATQKELQAEAEKARIEREALNSYIQAFGELISKALNTMDTLQQSTNQTRTKIMG